MIACWAILLRCGAKLVLEGYYSMQDNENPFIKAFQDPEAVARYPEGPPRFTPGFADLHKMATILLSERVPRDASVLVLGAGGGLELKAMCAAKPGWRFEGVDPAGEMVRLAKGMLGDDAPRVNFVQGYIEDASEGPFDGAVCLLTLHFLNAEDRMKTIRDVHRRLKPGAPFVVAHSSFPQEEDQRDLWLSRYEAFAVASGVEVEIAHQARTMVADRVELMSPEADEQFLRDGGFSDVQLFYAALTWRGWVAYSDGPSQ